MKLDYVFRSLINARDDEVVIATMTAGYLWPRYSTSERDFCYIAPMGSAAAVGLGLATARPDLRVWVLDGDGSLLMNLGVLVTIGSQTPSNLVHMVLRNNVYAITGGQSIVGVDTANFAAISIASGIARSHQVESEEEWDAFVAGGLESSGPVFVDVHVDSAYDKSVAHEYMLGRQAALTQGGTGFHNLRRSLVGEGPSPNNDVTTTEENIRPSA